MNYRLRLRF